MVWTLIAIFGAGSFIFSGFSVLTDPTCQSVDFGGGRIIQMTCRGDSLGAFSNIAAGWLSISGGLLLLAFIFRMPIKRAMNSFWNPKPIPSSSVFYDQSKPSADESVRPEPSQNESEESANSEGQKPCPKCAELIKKEAIKCRHCGSSLLPTFEDKFKEKLRNKNFKIGLAAVVILSLILGGVLVNSINLSKQRQRLNTTGQVCVFLEDGETNLGCADYPTVDFSFCSTAASMEIEYADSNYESIFDFQSTQATRFDGNTFNSCNEGFNYSYQINTITNRLIGDYDLSSWTYSVPASQEGKVSSGDGFVMKISLK